MRDQNQSESIEKLAKIIKEVTYAMLTTIDKDGALRSRPMKTQNTDNFNGELWFFTKVSAPKVDEVEHDHHVNVSYAHPSDQSYASVSGMAKLVRDQAKNNELWTVPMKAWFPNGPDDPELGLLHITVDKAEFWDTPGSAVVHLIGLIKATTTGKPYHPGENEKLDLHSPGAAS